MSEKCEGQRTSNKAQSAFGYPGGEVGPHCNYLRFCGSNVVKLFLCAAAIP